MPNFSHGRRMMGKKRNSSRVERSPCRHSQQTFVDCSGSDMDKMFTSRQDMACTVEGGWRPRQNHMRHG
jgi:hypothetical protein